MLTLDKSVMLAISNVTVCAFISVSFTFCFLVIRFETRYFHLTIINEWAAWERERTISQEIRQLCNSTTANDKREWGGKASLSRLSPIPKLLLAFLLAANCFSYIMGCCFAIEIRSLCIIQRYDFFLCTKTETDRQ